jgi:protein involved in polysaccharide export with SLBB domain
VAAQTYNPYQESGINYPGTRQAGEQTPPGPTRDAQVAGDQLQATNDQRYSPDRIESDREPTDRTTVRERDATTRDRDRDRDRDVPRTGETAVARRPVPPSEFETFASEIVDKPLRRFGANLLVPTARDFTAPPMVTIPSDYRINPGDQLVVGLTGSVQADSLRLVVNSDGRIFVPRVGAVTVAGVRYGDVQSVISAQVARQYRSFRVSVTMGALRGLTVYVTGFAQTPGSYTVSSLSTLVNAVLAAGGPSAGGSFRSIQLRRGGRLISDFDLYDLLLKGDKSGDATLQNGDVIFIAPAGAQVAAIGSVNNEAIFEARPGDTLTDILLYSGGVNTVADDTRLLLLDPLDVNNGWQQLSPGEARTRVAKRAAVLRVLSGVGIVRPLSRQPVLVTVNGEVAKPGRYYVPPGTSVEAVIAQAGGLTGDAYAFGTVFTRDTLRLQQRQSYERALKDTQFLLTTVPLTSALQQDANQVARLQTLRSAVDQLEQRRPDGRLVLEVAPDATAPPGDLVLENNDVVFVPNRPVTVGVFGSVPSPASFRYQPARTIGDYVKQAGGVQKIGDRGEIFVIRANGMLLAPKRGAFSGSILKQRALPGDLIYVPINPNRDAFWARLRDLTQVLFTGALTTASIVAVSK